MEGLELLVLIGTAIIVGGVIAARIRVPPPLVLLLLGAGLGFVPMLGEVALPPDLVILLFLPALLYWESLNTSLREIRRNTRVIVLLSIFLVFFTAAVVAVIGHAFGLSWPVAFALGAILAPTDATAVASVLGRLPRRAATVVRAESLINDGTALVLYAIAVNIAVTGETLNFGQAALEFVGSYLVGILIGVAVGLLVMFVRRHVRDRLIANTLSVLTPFLAYFPAELLHVSGVVAVVTAGLVLSQAGPGLINASTRSQAFGFWQLATYVLNGALFVLIGFELHNVTDGIGVGWLDTLLFGLATALTVLAARIGWINITTVVIRLLDRRPSQRARRATFRQRFVTGWAGFRGAVSLAAALALPTMTSDGEPLPGRDLVIAVTFIVILFTLVVQGLSMPAIIRWGRLAPDPTEFDEVLQSEQAGLQAELDALPEVAKRMGSSDSTVEHVRRMIEMRLERIHRNEDPMKSFREPSEIDGKSALQAELIPIKRAAVFRLRRQGAIDDVVLRRVQARMDLEELRLSAPAEDE